jgi:hypothetical protein
MKVSLKCSASGRPDAEHLFFGTIHAPGCSAFTVWSTGVASFSEVREGLRERFRSLRWPEKWPRPPNLNRPVKIALISFAAILGALLVFWVVLNFLLANPKTGTPMINWALGAFGNEKARIVTGRLAHPFSNRFEMRSLDWPGRAEAEEIHLTYDLFGFLPGRPWARKLYVRNGEVMLEDKTDDRRTLNPQALVDAVEVENISLKFTRRNKLREVTIVKAGGSFSSGTVSGEAVSGKGRLTFDNLRREWDGGLRGAITVKGDNLKNLAELVGVSAPDTPPFNVKGELRTHQRTWSVEKLAGRVGDSDIGGVVSVDLKPKKPFLTVDLKSRKLDFDDMGVVFGLPVGADRGEITNEEQREAKAKYDRSARLIPDTHLDFARLAAVNADISFEAPRVVDAPFGINAMTMKGELRDQVLDFSRFLVRTGQGDLDARIRINAQDDPAKTRATGTLDSVPITRIVNTTFVRGSLNGRFALNMTGSGFREAFGSATGEAGIWSNNSEVAKIATEAAGLDFGEILLLIATDEDREYLKSRCLAAGLNLRNGLGALNPAVIDNEDSLIAASGHIDLRNEALDIEVFARPHDVSIGKVFGDIRIKGTMRNPKISALDGKTVLQAGLSALLSTIAGPLLALPFIEIGGEPDAPCVQLLADARNPGQAQTPPPKSSPPKKS